MEINENNYHEITKEVLESDINHLGDIIFFFLGSLLSLYYIEYFIKHHSIRWLGFILSFIVLFQEVFREIYPYTGILILLINHS